MYMTPGRASSTPPIPTARTPRRSTSPAPTSRATAARPPACSPPPSPRRCDRARRSTRSSTSAAGLAHDGTAAAIEAVAAVAAELTDWRAALGPLRAAVEPFDTVGPHYRSPGADARRPSRTKSIEELPVALGMALVADGDYREAVLGASTTAATPTRSPRWPGRSPAPSAVPAPYRRTGWSEVATASRIDLTTPAAHDGRRATGDLAARAERAAAREAARAL